MAATPVTVDTPAPDFRLPGTDGRTHAFDDIAGENRTVIVFICNHCPYVKAMIDRLVADARALMAASVGFAAICSNDAEAYPADSFEAMQRFAQAHAFPFAYLHDEDQSVARACGAVCTPDFFGYGARRRLKYRGRLDEGRTSLPPPGARRELGSIRISGVPAYRTHRRQQRRGCSTRPQTRHPRDPDASLHRPVSDLLGCTYPIVLAGVRGVARSELVAAVTKAGGFGFLGMVRHRLARQGSIE